MLLGLGTVPIPRGASKAVRAIIQGMCHTGGEERENC